MSRLAHSLVWTGALALLPLAASGLRASATPVKPAAMPEVLRTGVARPDEYPTWVDAKRLFTPAGKLDTRVLDPEAVRYIERALATPAKDGCIEAGAILIDRIVINGNYLDRTSLDATFRSAGAVIRGRVTGVSTGFQGSFPGTLIRFEPVADYKDDFKPQPVYYTFVPVGRVQIGDRVLCKTDPNYAELPAVGDEVVLFEPKGYRGDERFLDSYDGAGVVTVKRDGTLALPRSFAASVSPRKLAKSVDLFARLEELEKENSR
jgi:hypothetical protein